MPRLATIEITFPQGVLFPSPPTVLRVNDAAYKLTSVHDSRLHFRGPFQESIVFVTLPHARPACGFLPDDILICDRRYTRRFDGFYLPVELSPSEVESFFDSIADQYDDAIDLTLNRHVICRMLRTSLACTNPNRLSRVRVLDYGCGTGLSWEELTRLRSRNPAWGRVDLFGCDFSSHMIQESRRRGFDAVRKCGYASTDFPAGFFDLIFCGFVVHYFADPRPLKEIKRILAPSGRFLLNLPARDERKECFIKARLLEGDLRGHSSVRARRVLIRTDKTREIPILTYSRSWGRNTGRRKRRPHEGNGVLHLPDCSGPADGLEGAGHETHAHP